MTILSNQYNFIYVHLHKCGGTSIEKAFENVMSWQDLIIGSTDFGESNQEFYKTKFGLHKHSNASEIIKALGEKKWNRFKTFTTVRDPKTLYQSYYNWAASKVLWTSKNEKNTIEKWKKQIQNKEYEPNFLSWGAIQSYLKTECFSDFVKHSINETTLPGPLCDRLKNDANEIVIDKIYKLEEIWRAWQFLERNTKKKITRIKENKSMKFETIYDEEAKNLVNEFHDEDFYLFKYEKFN